VNSLYRTAYNPARGFRPDRGWAARGACDGIGLGPGEQELGQAPGHSYGGYKQSSIGREFSLEGMLERFTQPKNVTVDLNTPRRQ